MRYLAFQMGLLLLLKRMPLVSDDLLVVNNEVLSIMTLLRWFASRSTFSD